MSAELRRLRAIAAVDWAAHDEESKEILPDLEGVECDSDDPASVRQQTGRGLLAKCNMK